MIWRSQTRYVLHPDAIASHKATANIPPNVFQNTLFFMIAFPSFVHFLQCFHTRT